MIYLALWILSLMFIIFILSVGFGTVLFIIKTILSIPCVFYIENNKYHLRQRGYDVDSKDLPKMRQILRFYFRALTLRRPLLP